MTTPKRAHFSRAFATEEKESTPPTPLESLATKEEKRGEKGSPAPQQKSRINKVQIPVYVAPEARKQLKILSAETGRTQEDLLKEAMNDLFRKHNKPVIA